MSKGKPDVLQGTLDLLMHGYGIAVHIPQLSEEALTRAVARVLRFA